MKDEAVSSVVSAVLIFALFSTSFLLWTLNQQPEWIADREHNHIQGLREDMGALQAGLDRLSAADEAGPVTQSFRLAASPLPLLQRAPATGVLAMEGTFDWSATFTAPRLHAVDGSPVGTPSATPGTPVTDVVALRSLELELTSTGINGNNDEATVTATATDGTQSATLTLRHAGSVAGCSGSGVEVLVNGPTGSPSRIDFCEADQDLSGHRVDALDPQFGLPAALSRLDAGYSLSVSTAVSGGTVSGTFSAAWSDSDGRPHAVGNGLSVPGYTQSVSSTPLRFTGNPLEQPDQDVVWEGGAVLASQADGAAVARDPAFLLAVDGTAGFLRWTVVETTGDGATAGSGSASAQVVHDATERVLLTADGAAFTLQSGAAAAWAGFFTDQITLAGTADASVTTAGDQVTLTLAQGTVATWTIELRTVHATVSVS